MENDGCPIEVKKTEIVTTFIKMTIFQRCPEAARDLLINLPFMIIKGLWKKYLVYPRQCAISFNTAVSVFKDSVISLFGEKQGGSAALAYFPAHLRNPIMDAAHSTTLIKMVYNGVERLVEPYSLVYKTRKDGVAQEYFYGWDTTGGNTSGQGIKSFLHSRIQSINL